MSNNIPFWEEIYLNDDITAFTINPNKTLTEFEHLLNKNADILEAGCGEGQNVLYLAKNGFHNIDTFDISEAGISKLKRLCIQNGVDINAFVSDLREYRLIKNMILLCPLQHCALSKKIPGNILFSMLRKAQIQVGYT